MMAQRKSIALCLAAAVAAAIALFFLQRNVPEKTTPSTVAPPSSQPSAPGKEPASQKGFSARINHPAPKKDQEELKPMETALETTAQLTDFLNDGEDARALNEVRRLHQNSDREVRLMVAEAVRWLGLPAAMEAASMMDDPDEEIRLMARDTFWSILRELEDPKLKKDLLETALSSNDPELRIEALDELLYLPDALSSNLLMRATNDPDETVAEQARNNLSFITGDE